MHKRRASQDANQLTFEPIVYVPAITARQPDGSLIIRPGKPIVLNGEDEIGTGEAAKIIGVSQRTVIHYCDNGVLQEGIDWRRPGRELAARPEDVGGKTSGVGNYKIKRAAALRIGGHQITDKDHP